MSMMCAISAAILISAPGVFHSVAYKQDLEPAESCIIKMRLASNDNTIIDGTPLMGDIFPVIVRYTCISPLDGQFCPSYYNPWSGPEFERSMRAYATRDRVSYWVSSKMRLVKAAADARSGGNLSTSK